MSWYGSASSRLRETTNLSDPARLRLGGYCWGGHYSQKLAANAFAGADGVGTLRNRRAADGGSGSWLCKNAAPCKTRRIIFSSACDSHGSNFRARSFLISVRNIILSAFALSEFSHSLGQTRRLSDCRWHVSFTPDTGRIAATQRSDASGQSATSHAWFEMKGRQLRRPL